MKKYLIYNFGDATFSVTDNEAFVRHLFPHEDIGVIDISHWGEGGVEHFRSQPHKVQVRIVEDNELYDEIKLELERNPL
jgi:hypothetical protein